MQTGCKWFRITVKWQDLVNLIQLLSSTNDGKFLGSQVTTICAGSLLNYILQSSDVLTAMFMKIQVLWDGNFQQAELGITGNCTEEHGISLTFCLTAQKRSTGWWHALAPYIAPQLPRH